MKNFQGEIHSGIYVFEGIDNVGKSTIIQKLKGKIEESTQYKCVIVSFPGNDPRTLGNLVYDIHHYQDKYFEIPINETSLQLLHVASHIDLIQRKLKKLCDSPCIVLMDRFWWSTYVYGLAGNLREDIIKAIIEPELMYWQDINIKKIFLLEKEKRVRDYGIEKDKKIVSIYRELAYKESKCVMVKNDGSIDEVTAHIYNSIF